MAHFDPRKPLRIPCAGRGCEHHIIGDDSKEYCTFWRQAKISKSHESLVRSVCDNKTPQRIGEL